MFNTQELSTAGELQRVHVYSPNACLVHVPNQMENLP